MASDKRFPPSQKRKKEAVRRGDFPKSRALTSCWLLTAIYLALRVGLFYAWKALEQLFADNLPGERDFHTNNMLLSHAGAYWAAGILLLPLLVVCVVSALLAEAAQVGIRIGEWANLLRWERLNVVQTAKKTFGVEGIFEVFRDFCAWGVGIIFLLFTLRGILADPEFWMLTEVAEGLPLLCSLARGLAEKLLFLGWVFAFADYTFQRRRFLKRHSMSLEEVREEMKESEGNPEIRSMRRQLQHELASHSNVQAVRKAKVLLVGNRGRTKTGNIFGE